MQPNGSSDINLTLIAWADIVLEKWHFNIADLDIIDKGYLDNSLIHNLLINAGQDIDRIDFSFKLYGIFVDMGVGGEIRKGNSGDIGSDKVREAKEWYSKKFYGQIMKLKQILIEKYSRNIAWSMMNLLSESLDQRYTSSLQAPAVMNLRSVKYRATTNARNARNYAERRKHGGRWRNDHKTWK